jgi:hypothetical protein
VLIFFHCIRILAIEARTSSHIFKLIDCDSIARTFVGRHLGP